MREENSYNKNTLSSPKDEIKTNAIKHKIKLQREELQRLERLLSSLENNKSAQIPDSFEEPEFNFENLERIFADTNFYREFFNQLPFLIWAKDVQGRYLTVNKSFADSYGKNPEDIIACNDYDFAPAVFAEKYVSDDKFIMESGTPKSFEELIPLSNGFRWHETLKIPLIDSSGQVIGTAGLARDVTEKKNYEIALKESEEKFRELAENTNDAFIIRSGNEIIYVNHAFEKIFGVSRDEFRESPDSFNERIHQEDKSRIIKILESTEYKSSFIFNEQFRIVQPSGKISWIWHRSYPVLNNQGEVYRTISVSSDISSSKILENEVRKFESQQKAILDNIPHLAWLKDREGRYLMANEAFCRFFDWTLEHIIGKTDFDLCPEELAKVYVENDRTVFEKRKAMRFYEVEEGRFGKRYSETYKTPVFDESGIFIGTAGISRDITEQKIAEQALIKSEEKFKGLVTLLPEIIFETNNKGHLSFANTRFFERLGYSQSDFDKGINLQDLFPDYEQDRINNSYNKLKQGAELESAEYYLISKDKSEFPALVYTNNLYNNNNWCGIRGVAVDISKRKLFEEKEKTYKEKLQFLGNTALDFLSLTLEQDIYSFIGSKLKEFIPEGYVIVSKFYDEDHSIRLRYFSGEDSMVHLIENRTGVNILNFNVNLEQHSIDELTSNSGNIQEFAEGIHDLSFQTIPLPLAREIEKIMQVKRIFGLSLLRKGILFGTVIILTKNDELEDKPLIETFVYQATIALHRRQIEKELVGAKIKAEESDKLKTAFLANMSHEIRTPMNGILGISQLLSKQELPDAERKEYLAMINANGNILLNLVNDIIDISKIESNMVEIHESEFSLNQLFNELNCFALSEKMTKSKDAVSIILKPGKSDEESYVIADKQKILQVLTNLVGNAIKFTISGSIEISYVFSGQELEFYVKDTGIGLPEDKISELFNRFTQADQSLTRPYGGSGLGLAISKGFVDLMQGKIWAESRKEGGSEFGFSIPYKPSDFKYPGVTLKKSRPDDFDWSMYHILVVEDNYMSFRLLQALLRKTQVNIIHAENGLKALEMVQNMPEINLVLMDIQLPVMNGYEATIEIKKLRPDLPVIAQTANAMDDDRLKCLNCGCSDYITKPIVFNTFMNLVNTYIGKS
ncbi:MAG: PAS domain S-box protein [Bacteroidales bacterium]|nr:PAS domain S-box protein [Bacteroidales bacterium]